MCKDLGEGSRCCLGYSVAGFVFTLWIGILLATQPFFIAGIEDADQAKNNAFGAMGMFLFTFFASLGGMYYDSNFKKEQPPQEKKGPHMGYQLSGNTAQYGATSS
mmetsp:Transcript_2487/g.3553  ORF Transcript_2487/g.3553 Transcript_2487/m.3553 type:complete len:105 (+) Transcript_2487:107-421(+)|eukprot:CAMPEP_0202451574 /NCGR_PEP_ID=MMETSP1360-20130828/9983_1 /ASSEMBLY_ACC=CAM_ASM_000848 /TAXON_ID=515479 /ORGANISM="Licmophora paradoxa, Strain CCMP2313" /LENGTH=104 /DNA_ID=CAMNT_0049070175 /DNA_START=103 /DNA_END=417 /DNA_ORIENTATION=+